MEWVGRWFVVLAVVLGAFAPLMAGTDKAFACSCSGLTPEEQVDMSSAVVLGTVSSPRRSAAGAHGFEFIPSSIWKDSVESPLVVWNGPGSCSVDIEEGSAYVIGLWRDQWGDPWATGCGLVMEAPGGELPQELLFLRERPRVDQPIRMRQGSYGVLPQLQSANENTGLQADWKLAVVAAGSFLSAAVVVFVGKRT